MAVIIYDGECGLCDCARKAVEPLDMLRAFEWVPFQDPAAERFGIPRREMEESVWLISGERRWSGFSAVKQIALRLPPLYAAAGLAVWRYPVSAIGIGLIFSPLFSPLGQGLYHWVSVNRHRVPLSACGRETKSAFTRM